MEGEQPPPTDLNLNHQDWRNSPDERNPIEESDHKELTHPSDILECTLKSEPLSQDYPTNVDNDHGNVFPDINYPILNWSGEFNYHVEFNQTQDRTKHTPWIFSSKLTKLYVQMDTICPVNFKLKVPPNSNYQIRGQIVFFKLEDFPDPVERCIDHQKQDIVPLPHASHVLRCDDASSSYHDNEKNRHSVVIKLTPGCQNVSLSFRFMCFSSCFGGRNRRQTKLVFTLENLRCVF